MPYLNQFEDFVKLNQLVKSSLSVAEASMKEKVKGLEAEKPHPVMPSRDEVSKRVLGLSSKPEF
jgi:hypothetical protein